MRFITALLLIALFQLVRHCSQISIIRTALYYSISKCAQKIHFDMEIKQFYLN